jgi:polyisoprenoid-binding protein YceI
MNRLLSKISVLLVFVAVLAACGGAPAPAVTPTSAPAAPAESSIGTPVSGQRTFVVVPAESKASYLVDEEFFGGALDKLGIAAGVKDVIGSTQEIEGQLQLNLDDLSASLGENSFIVKMNTLTTDQSRRDTWIREDGPRFNDFPIASFKATAIEGAPGAYNEGDEVSFKLSGDLTVREVTKPATFEVTARLVGDTLTGTATTRLLMSDFGIEPPNFANTLTVADEFGIEVQITAREGSE